MIRLIVLFLLIHLVSFFCFAAEKNTKGLLPEVSLTKDNEDENEKRAFQSEVMITRSENTAIESLQSIIKKKKGTKEEADLWYRLAELYMRRSKSGRFFDLHQENAMAKLSPFPLPKDKGSDSVQKAAKIYTKLENEFPSFRDMDAVLFNNAFAHQQLGQLKTSEQLYAKLLLRFPQSPLVADATLAAGELLYDQGRFKAALEHFIKIESFPKSRVYSYGIYKAAWSYYNLQESDKAIQKLVQVVKVNPPILSGEVPTNRHHLRREALRDLTVFIGDIYPASKLYSFFDEITNEDEIGQSMMDMAKLYQSHSREKEMDTFLVEYIDKRPSGSRVVEAHLMLVEANESLKKRAEVLNHLQSASDLCRASSPWKVNQKPESLKASCIDGFHHASLEMAKKWWEIWLKNKQNKDFSDLTQKLFKLILENEDPAQPDIKTRFAYAELLFQMGTFDQASSQYKIVADKATDPSMAHDAAYAALYSIEKYLEQKKDSSKEAERKILAQNYLTKHPHGKYSILVQFKLGHIAYEENNYIDAEKWLKPLTALKTQEELKRKSEDLILDILNLKKDYKGIQAFSKQVATGSSDENRKKNMKQIFEEAHFTEIQDFAKGGDKDQASQKLLEFAQEHPNSKLSQEAMWQALSLLYSQGKNFEAAEQTLNYVKKYPEDKRNNDALKEAAKTFADIGQISKSAEVLEKISTTDKSQKHANLELAADIYLLEKRYKEARNIFNHMINESDRKTSERLYGKLLDSYKSSPSPLEFDKLQSQILSKGIEPFATQIMINKAKLLLEDNKLSAAFDLSLKANGRDVTPEIRAEARLIQAQILEKELIQQSVKSREDKFALVLGMKTEKLDKAHTAYYSTLKMSKDPQQQLQAFRGIDRCYANFIESLGSMALPASLNDSEKEVLRAEIAKLIAPIQEKKKENAAKLKALAASQSAPASEKRGLESIAINETLPTEVHYPAAPKMLPYLPANNPFTSAKMSQFDTRSIKACDKNSISFEATGNCYFSKQYENVEKIGLALAKTSEQRALGLFYVSLASEARGYEDKALWMIESALKLRPDFALFLYQKARLIYKQDGLKNSLPLFAKVIDMQMSSTELNAFAGVKAFSEGDYTSTIQKISLLSKEQMYNLNVGALLSEAYAQKGEVEKALAVLKDLLGLKKESTDLLLQQAHVLENYKGSPTLALDSYERAFKSTSQQDVREWLGRKIEYLKNQNKVGQHVIPEDL